MGTNKISEYLFAEMQTNDTILAQSEGQWTVKEKEAQYRKEWSMEY